MTIKDMVKYSLFIATLLLTAACSRSESEITVRHEKNRDNIINISDEIISIDNRVPDMHSATGLRMFGDTLIFKDSDASDYLFVAYDANTERTVGRFGKFGNGPGEVANTGALFYDNNRYKLYAINYNRSKLISFDLSKALSDSTYSAIDEFDWNCAVGNNQIISAFYLTDEEVFCSIYVPDKSGGYNSMTSHIAKFNLKTRALNIIDSISPTEKVRSGMAVSPRLKLIFCADKKQDKIKIYNFDGCLSTCVYGPEYEEKINRRHGYFGTTVWCGDKVAALYSGKDSSETNDKVIIFDKDGNYLATLKFDFTVYSIAYHERTGRLYLSTYGEPQFGYIELDKVLNSTSN